MKAGLLGEDEVYKAIRRLDAPPLVAMMQAATFEDEARHRLLGQLLRASSLVDPRRTAPNVARFGAFRAELRDAFAASGGDWAAWFDAVMEQLELAEDGYRRILAARQASDYAAMEPSTRIWAALHRGAQEAIQIRRDVHERLKGQAIVMPQNLAVQDPNGRPVAVNAITDAIIHSAGATLNIEGRTLNLVDDSGVITVPPPVDPSGEACDQAGANQYLAIIWRNWASLEERARFLNGQLVRRTRPDVPTGFPDFAETLVEARGSLDPFEIWISQHRLNDSSDQIYLRSMGNEALRRNIVGFAKGAPAAPDGWVSLDEALAFAALAGTLGDAVTDPERLIDGLTVSEWLRGYAVLSELVSVPIRADREQLAAWLPRFTPQDLLDHLIRNGLPADKALLLIDQARFRTGSTDLYDAPLIQCADGTLVAFGPALYGATFAGILLSIFARKEIDFAGKGKHFEQKVLALLHREGLTATGYKTSRGEDQFEYDVLLAWDAYLFVFECKNRSLPRDNAPRMYNFLRETKKQIRQAQRLAEGLRKWPDIVEKALGVPLGDRTIVPVILNNLPYARSGETDGVWFYDYQALARFFQSRSLGFSVGQLSGQIEDQAEIIRIWRGAAPAAEDLMRQLEDPVQLRFNREMSKVDTFAFQLDRTTIASELQRYREALTPDAAARVAGVPLHVMRQRERKLLKKSRKASRRAREGQIGGRRRL